MTIKNSKGDLRLFTEKELNENVTVGIVYLPQTFSLIFLLKGSLTIKYNLSEFTISGPCLFSIIKNGVYEFTDLSKDKQLFGVSFDTTYLRDLGIFQKSTSGIGIFSTGNNPEQKLQADRDIVLATSLFTTLSEIYNAELDNEMQKTIIQHSFLALFYFSATVYERTNAVQAATVSRSILMVRQFLNLITKNYKNEKTLKFYADKLNVSPKHLSATVKKVTGSSAGTYIDRAVIIGAKLLLNDPSLNIAEVSQELNFSDQFTFSKFFKKHTSLSPSMYRQKEGTK